MTSVRARSGAVAVRRRRHTDLRVALLFIGPAALGFLAFYFVPSLRGIWFSFTDQNLIGSGEFIGTTVPRGCSRIRCSGTHSV